MEEAIARFEAKYATATHFQAGKTGVKVSLDGDKNKYGGNKLAEVGSLTKDVYFTEAVDYYTFVNNGLVADISDVIATYVTGNRTNIAKVVDGYTLSPHSIYVAVIGGENEEIVVGKRAE